MEQADSMVGLIKNIQADGAVKDRLTGCMWECKKTIHEGGELSEMWRYL